jgi:hypothetical protein
MLARLGAPRAKGAARGTAGTVRPGATDFTRAHSQGGALIPALALCGCLRLSALSRWTLSSVIEPALVLEHDE